MDQLDPTDSHSNRPNGSNLSRPAKRWDLVIIAAVALLANFVYLYFSNGDYYYPDSFTYLAPARSMLHGNGFLSPTGAPDSIRTPGYPLLLILFGVQVLPVIIVQHLLNVALAIAIYVLLFARSGNRPMAIVAGLLFAIDVPSIHNANKILTETPFTVLLFAIFWLVLQKGRLPLIAILIGALVLVRPIAMFLCIPLAIVFAVQGVPLRRVAAFVAIALLLPAGWAVRNRVRTGVFTVSSIGDLNLLSHRAAAALAIEDAGDDFSADLADEQSGLQDDADDAIQRQLHIDDAQELPIAVRAKFYGRYALRVIAQHPVAFVELTVRGVLVNLFDSDWDSVQIVSSISPEVVRLALGAVPPILFAFGVAGLIALWRSDRELSLMILIFAVYFIGISAGSEAEARFRVPVAPQMAIAAAAGIIRPCGRHKSE